MNFLLYFYELPTNFPSIKKTLLSFSLSPFSIYVVISLNLITNQHHSHSPNTSNDNVIVLFTTFSSFFFIFLTNKQLTTFAFQSNFNQPPLQQTNKQRCLITLEETFGTRWTVLTVNSPL